MLRACFGDGARFTIEVFRQQTMQHMRDTVAVLIHQRQVAFAVQPH